MADEKPRGRKADLPVPDMHQLLLWCLESPEDLAEYEKLVSEPITVEKVSALGALAGRLQARDLFRRAIDRDADALAWFRSNAGASGRDRNRRRRARRLRSRDDLKRAVIARDSGAVARISRSLHEDWYRRRRRILGRRYLRLFAKPVSDQVTLNLRRITRMEKQDENRRRRALWRRWVGRRVRTRLARIRVALFGPYSPKPLVSKSLR